MGIGLDAGSLVYNMFWACLVWVAGLGAPWEDNDRAHSDETHSPRLRLRKVAAVARGQGASARRGACCDKSLPAAWNATTRD
eukprot:5089405-Pyramimonas_sp.AAC.1